MPVFWGITFLIVLLIVTIKYPAVSLVLLLAAGTVKGLLISHQYRVVGFFDPIVLSAAWVFLSMMYVYIKNPRPLKEIINIPFGLYALLSAILLLGLSYTSAPNYGFAKTWRFATIGFIGFFAPIVLVDNLKDMKVVLLITLTICIMVSIFTIMAPRTFIVTGGEGWERAGFLERGPLGAAIIAAIGALIAFCFAIMPHRSPILRILSTVLMPVLLIGIVVTGSRGPLVGLTISILAALVIYRRYLLRAWPLIVFMVVIAATSFVFVNLAAEKTVRFTQLFYGTHEIEPVLSSRTVRWAWTLEHVDENPVFGSGTGAWASDNGYGDTREYPHNIILESLYEEGLVGATVLSLFIFLIFKRWRQASKLISLGEVDTEAFQIIHVVGLLFLLTFLEAMKSGDIEGNRFMFFFAGLVVAVSSLVRHRVEEISSESELGIDGSQQLEEGGFQDAEVLYRG
jgi:O-antigen ligase